MGRRLPSSRGKSAVIIIFRRHSISMRLKAFSWILDPYSFSFYFIIQVMLNFHDRTEWSSGVEFVDGMFVDQLQEIYSITYMNALSSSVSS